MFIEIPCRMYERMDVDFEDLQIKGLESERFTENTAVNTNHIESFWADSEHETSVTMVSGDRFLVELPYETFKDLLDFNR